MTTTRRRPLLLALAGGTAAVAGIGTAARTGLIGGGGDPAGGARLELSSGDMGVESLTLPLDDRVLVEGASPGGGLGGSSARRGTGKLATTTYSMVGFTWTRGEAEPVLELSVRRGSAWEPWSRVPGSHESPDPGTGEIGSVVGSELVWVGPTDGVRVRVVGERPSDLALVLLHPTPLPGDEAALDDADDSEVQPLGRTSARTSAEVRVPRPNIRNRRAWGANEDLRDKPPSYITTVQQVHVHHTVNSNSYAAEDVPALIRGMYAYHTQSLGWSDIGYNFLVDRFGRIWTGRAGGAAKNVRGAHTLGFNHNSAGISVIGNFDQVKPPSAVIAAIARVAAWKLDQYDRDPLGRTTVVSEGSDKFRSGRSVTLPVIDGHRDTNDTSCPGSHLYAALPAIRQKTKTRIDNFRTRETAVAITAPFTASGRVVFGQRLVVRPGTWTPAEATPTYTWLRDGEPIGGARGEDYNVRRGDVGSRISVRVDLAAPGSAPASQTVSWPSRGRSNVDLVVRAAGRKGRALISVVATAPALPSGHPEGPVTVKVAGKTLTLRLREGRAERLVRGLEPGTYDVRAVFEPTAVAARARATDTVRVKPLD
ncbi:N-acetylmuramoyl-L-alanine amidase [Nocardioides sp. SOB77]|uniref:N-acetylmuramoyl-L-alanine amidase n=1 Tax=Nocardioides oceani TaxID=3058369 RepID=A0ABT8FKD7_9ACTN|nr:N-acetylmuramoyl-L-alanine amidase [Nocardioides oceani]MDN4174986.1 N-acetylmuramoyl-L-alanine amidase [Nocardioides oceani]